MRHKNSVLHGLLQHLPWGTFDRLVEEHGGDKGMRTLSAKPPAVTNASSLKPPLNSALPAIASTAPASGLTRAFAEPMPRAMPSTPGFSPIKASRAKT